LKPEPSLSNFLAKSGWHAGLDRISATASSQQTRRCSESREMSNVMALVSLDFGGAGSMCGIGKELTPMDAQLVEATIKLYLTEIRNRLDRAAGIGRAADACAGAGFHEKGLEVALDIEQLLYEATTLLNAASLINRIARQS
jgi:hypothetical protein